MAQMTAKETTRLEHGEAQAKKIDMIRERRSTKDIGTEESEEKPKLCEIKNHVCMLKKMPNVCDNFSMDDTQE